MATGMAERNEALLDTAQEILNEWADRRRDIEQALVRPSEVLGFGSTLEVYMKTSARYRDHAYYYTSHLHPSSFFYAEEDREALLASMAQRTYLAMQEHIVSGGFDEEVEKALADRAKAEGLSPAARGGRGDSGAREDGGTAGRRGAKGPKNSGNRKGTGSRDKRNVQDS